MLTPLAPFFPPPPLWLLPLLGRHTETIFVCGAQSRLIAAVALGHNLPLAPSRPLTWHCLGNVATRRPQLGPLNGLADIQVREQKIRALGYLICKKCHEARIGHTSGRRLWNAQPPVNINGVRR